MLDALLAALTLPILAMNSCPDPAITRAIATQIGNNGNLKTYDVAITVTNEGAREAASLLQSIDVYQDATKVDRKGTRPLPAGAHDVVHYRFTRSAEARPGSTHLRFRLMTEDPHGTYITDCSTSNDTFHLNV